MMPRSVLIAAMMVGAAASPASAACAWVLWQQWGPVWFLEAAMPSYNECRDAARQETELRRQADALVDREGNARIWHCVPDTIDPRAPKGGR